MPAREKSSATFLAAALEGRGAVESVGEAELGGLEEGCSAGPRYKPVRGELMRRSSRLVNHTASGAQTTSPICARSRGQTSLSTRCKRRTLGQAGQSPEGSVPIRQGGTGRSVP